MKIFFDNIIFSLQKAGGISLYWYEMIMQSKDRTDIQYITHKNSANNIYAKSLRFLNSTREFELPMFIKRFLPLLIRIPKGSIFHSSYQRICIQKSVINIITIHDLGYELRIMQTGFKRTIHIFFKKIALRFADGIICVSENTKRDLLYFYPFVQEKHIKVIYNGISKEYLYLNIDIKNPGIVLPDKYILFVGSRFTYKNFYTVVETLEKNVSYHLVIAGGPEPGKNEMDVVERKLPNRNLYLLGLSIHDLKHVYKNAFCLVYPSSYEGFGLPILEAMSCACPFIALGNSSIPEVAGNAGLLINDLNTETINKQIEKLENQKFRQQIIELGLIQVKKFSWDKCACETFEFYDFVKKNKST